MSGSWSRPARFGSTPFRIPGETRGTKTIRAARRSTELEHPIPIPLGHELERVVGGMR